MFRIYTSSSLKGDCDLLKRTKVCRPCGTLELLPSGNGCAKPWCHNNYGIKGCTCSHEDDVVCPVCLDRVKEREKSEREYEELIARLHKCWCGEQPDVYSRCESTGSTTKVLYSYVTCDACRTTGHNTVESDDPEKRFTLEDVIEHWNTQGWKGRNPDDCEGED